MTSPYGTLYQNEKKRKILTVEDNRVNVIKRHNAGESARSIAKALDCSKTQIQVFIYFPFYATLHSETTCLVRPLSRGRSGGL